MALIGIPVWFFLDASGWDLAIYHAAIRALRIGHDPYADAIAAQVAYHNQLGLHLAHASDPPYNFVYSPITLPLLRIIGRMPEWLSGLAYWLAYATGALAVVWAAMQNVEEAEQEYFAFLAPVALFFPGLLENGVILSGNVAYIIYGVVLVTAVTGWRSGRWRWFYVAVLAASCFKAPLLTLLSIPLLSAADQWFPVGLTAGAGVFLFAVQRLIWPVLFSHFLDAIELQLRYNRDFGASPSGVFAGVLFDHGMYDPHYVLVFYLLYAVPLFSILSYLSRKCLGGAFPLSRWIPVLLPGVILLNPRIIEYDLALLTIPLALIVWRLFPGLFSTRGSTVSTVVIFAAINIAAGQNWIVWKNIACLLLVSLFSAGVWQLLKQYELDPAGEFRNLLRGWAVSKLRRTANAHHQRE